MKHKSDTFYAQLYQILQNNILTNQILLKVRKRFELLCPARETYIVKKTVSTLLFTWGIMLSEIIGMFLMIPSIWQLTIAILIAGILHYEIILFCTKGMELKILSQFEQFLTEIRHHYYVSHMVDEAIYESLEQTRYEMRVHAQKIYEIITSENCEELAEQYHLSSHNHFLNLFLALCVTVVEYGDRTVNKQSLFLTNLSNLKMEINIETLKIRQQNYLYAGLTFVILLPMTLLKVIANWGISNLEELSSFYQGTMGNIVACIIVLVTYFIYQLVNNLKDSQVVCEKDYLLAKWFLSHKKMEQWIAQYIKNHEKKTKAIKEKLEASNRMIPIKQFLMAKFLYAGIGFFFSLCFSMYIMVCEQKLYQWYELIIAIIVSMFCYQLPNIQFFFQRKFAQMGREDEVIRFQSIILILMYIEKISAIEVLERIEDFSYVFKKPIQNCINNYNASEEAALMFLKQLPLKRCNY